MFQTQVGQACTQVRLHWNVSVSLLLTSLHTCRIDVTYVPCRNQTADLRFSGLVFARIVSDQQGQPGQPCVQVLEFTHVENKLVFAFTVWGEKEPL